MYDYTLSILSRLLSAKERAHIREVPSKVHSKIWTIHERQSIVIKISYVIIIRNDTFLNTRQIRKSNTNKHKLFTNEILLLLQQFNKLRCIDKEKYKRRDKLIYTSIAVPLNRRTRVTTCSVPNK